MLKLIEDHESVVAIVDQSARRINNPPQECIAFGILLIFIVAHLKGKEPEYIYDNNKGDEAKQ